MKQSWPITKLKPIKDHEEKPEDSVEIEKIMGKRLKKTANKVEYLVRWKGL